MVHFEPWWLQNYFYDRLAAWTGCMHSVSHMPQKVMGIPHLVNHIRSSQSQSDRYRRCLACTRRLTVKPTGQEKIMYRVGFPLWKIAARMNVPLLVKLEVMHDKDARVFIVTSPDLNGLVVEAPDNTSAEEMHKEINGCVCMLMEEALSSAPRSRSVTTAWPGEFSHA